VGSIKISNYSERRVINMKKKFMNVVIVLMLVVLVACSGSSSSSSEGSSDDGTVELTWQFWGGDDDRDIWEKIAKKVTEKHPNIKVKLQIYDWNTYWTKIKTQLASGTTADIVSMQSTQMPVYADKGALEPLNGFIDANPDINFGDFNDVIVEALSYKGDVYALPYDYGALTLYYNKDLFDKYDVPYPEDGMTWDEFVSRAKKLTHPEDKEYGFAFTGDLWNATPWIWQLGGEWLTQDDNYKLNTPESVEAFQFLSDLVSVHKVSPSAEQLSTSAYNERWQAGKVGMIIDGPWMLLSYKKFADFNFDVSTLPVGPTGENLSHVAGSGFGISPKSEYKEEAFKAISVITSEESLSMLAEAGRAYPSRDSVVDKYNESSGLDNVKAFQEQANNSRPFSTSPKLAEAQDIINQRLEAIFFGKAEVEPTLNDIQKELDELNNN
jgi:multiple sugar transport system substrate-binding protein